MTKRFGRPAPSFDEKAKSGPIRQINLPREGNSLEGLYALASARSDMRDAPYEVMRKENFNRGLAMWLIFALFVLAAVYSQSERATEFTSHRYSDHQQSMSKPE